MVAPPPAVRILPLPLSAALRVPQPMGGAQRGGGNHPSRPNHFPTKSSVPSVRPRGGSRRREDSLMRLKSVRCLVRVPATVGHKGFTQYASNF